MTNFNESQKVSVGQLLSVNTIQAQRIYKLVEERYPYSGFMLGLEKPERDAIFAALSLLIERMLIPTSSLDILKPELFGFIFEAFSIPTLKKYVSEYSKVKELNKRNQAMSLVASPDIELHYQCAFEYAFEKDFSIYREGNKIIFSAPCDLGNNQWSEYNNVSLPDYMLTRIRPYGERVFAIVEVTSKTFIDNSSAHYHQIARGESVAELNPVYVSNYQKVIKKLYNTAHLLKVVNIGKYAHLASMEEIIFVTSVGSRLPLDMLQDTWRSIATKLGLSDSQRNLRIVNIHADLNLDRMSRFADALIPQIVSIQSSSDFDFSTM